MAKLFSKEYHELSNTWYFKSKLLPLLEGDLHYQAVKNEQGQLIIRFYADPEKKKYMPEELVLKYDPAKEEIVEHACLSCPDNESCNHYLTILDYAYRYLTTSAKTKDQSAKNSVGTLQIDNELVVYSNRFLAYNTYWQLKTLNGKILIEDIYNEESDKIRFHFSGYEDVDLRLIALFSTNKLLFDTIKKRQKTAGIKSRQADKMDNKLLKEQTSAFNDSELALLHLLQNIKCSYSNKYKYFTIYKEDFIKVFPFLKDLQSKVMIKETGEQLIFSDEVLPLTLRINKSRDSFYTIKVAPGIFYSNFYMGNEIYIFVENVVYKVQLPFYKEISYQIFRGGYQFPEQDLVYFASIVAKQTGLSKCYLDIAEDIDIPPYNSTSPQVNLKLIKDKNDIVLSGYLLYSNVKKLPFRSILYSSELVAFTDDKGVQEWFYIPFDTRQEIQKFLHLLPTPQRDLMADSSQLVYSANISKDRLKKVLYEKLPAAWSLDLDDALKKEFIYRVDLKPIVSVNRTDKIDWFEYQVFYKYQEITFTHEELSRFFKGKEKYMKLADDRLVFFSDKENFTRIDTFLSNARKQTKQANYLSNYNLSYLYVLSKVNDTIRLEGETYLDKMFGDLLRRHSEEPVEVPRALFNIMRSYQKTGFYWLKMLQQYHLGGLLADDMGLGKTLQSLAILSDYHEQPNQQRKISLVVCPKTLLFNWAMEIEKFHPNLTYIIYEGSKLERVKLLDNNSSDIIIVSYSLVQMDIEHFNRQSYAYIILDEAQHIKNPLTLRSKAVKKLQGEYRLALTGTPIENNLIDLWSIFDFLLPGYLLPLRSFRKEFIDDNGDTAEKNDQLTQIISPFILRRKKSEVLLELPDKQEQYFYNKMTPLQERTYLKILALAKEKISFQKDKELKTDYINILTALIRLRQICNHPGLIDDELLKKINVSGKMELLLELIQDAVENRRKILVFSQFASMLKLISEKLEEKGLIYEYMDGKTVNRQERIEHFTNNEQVRIFLLTLKVGGLGLNLTAADTVIIVDPWWNPMSEDQSIDRVYRIGQTKKVLVYKIITKGTVEEKILLLQEQKKHLFSSVIEGSQSLIKKLSPADIRNLFEYHQ
ncbi:MAG: DEAD/DEAH box helicase [Candidatus Cloacimonetes bacterium]|nr:DEAD/DEAH box helicase [Candidatus Cloacimonadota bacterium]